MWQENVNNDKKQKILAVPLKILRCAQNDKMGTLRMTGGPSAPLRERERQSSGSGVD